MLFNQDDFKDHVLAQFQAAEATQNDRKKNATQLSDFLRQWHSGQNNSNANSGLSKAIQDFDDLKMMLLER